MRSKNKLTSPSPLRALVLPVYTPAALFSVASGIFSSVLVLAALSLGLTDAQASAAVGLSGLIVVLTSPAIGFVISRWGDRQALMAGGILAIGAELAIFFILNASSKDVHYQLFFVGSIIVFDLAAVVWQLARQAYVAEAVPANWRARGLSALGGMNRIGLLIGPALATAVLAFTVMRAVYLLAAFLLAGAVVLIWRFLAPNEKPHATSESASTKARTIPSRWATLYMGVTMNMIAILRSGYPVLIPLWGTHLGLSNTLITATFSSTALLDTVMFMMVGGIMDRYGRHAAILPSLIVMPMGIMVMAATDSTSGFIIGAAILGIGNGFGAGTVMTVGSDLSPVRNRASFLGIWQSVVNAGTALGPFVISWATHNYGVASALWGIAALGLLGAVWMCLTIKRAYAHLGRDLRGIPLAS